MKVEYFDDTDTALLEFSVSSVVDTLELSPNVYVDLDAKGQLVSMTMEHASETTSLPQVEVQRIEQSAG